MRNLRLWTKIRIVIELKDILIKLEIWDYNTKLSIKTEKIQEKGCPNGLYKTTIYNANVVGRSCLSCASSVKIRATKQFLEPCDQIPVIQLLQVES